MRTVFMTAMLGGRGGRTITAWLLAVQLTVQLLDALPAASAPCHAAVPAAPAPHGGAEQAEDQEQEEEWEQQTKEAEAKAPMRVPVIRDRRRSGWDRGGETLRQTELVRDGADHQRDGDDDKDPETVHFVTPFVMCLDEKRRFEM